MSPKSMTPETRCSASNRQLSGVRSLWITCARSSPKTGLTCSSNRSSTSSTTARLPASGMCWTSGRSSNACLTFQSSGCPADAWKNPRMATPSRAHATPNAYSVSRRSSSDAIVRPGSNVTIRTMWERPSGPTTSAWNRAVDRRDESHDRERRVGPGDVEQRLRLHVDHAGVVRGVADLQHEPAAVVGHELDVLVAFADERRPGGVHAEDVRRHPLRVARRRTRAAANRADRAPRERSSMSAAESVMGAPL